MMILKVFVFLFYVATIISAPTDDPVKVYLPVYQSQKQEDVKLNKQLETENHPAVQNTQKESTNNKASLITNFVTAKQDSFGGIFQAAPVTRENALQETEGWGSKVLSVKENVQNVVAGVFQPKPIVDTITEDEKYGNTGDKFAGVGRALVGGAESVSNLVNTVLEVPGKIFRQVTKLATEKLNNLGGKLIGL